MTFTDSPDGSRIWRTADSVHIDVRGLAPPGPMVAILRLLDSSEVDLTFVAHLDREPVFLYPELDDRGWSHEILPPSCARADGEDGVMLRMERCSA